jgi:RHS repeat-associated protein
MVRPVARLVLIVVLIAVAFGPANGIGAGQRPSPPALPQNGGASTTRLADGRILRLGGATAAGPVRSASIVDPATGKTTEVPGGMIEPRSWHAATLLPDGSVLIVGGQGQGGRTLATAERFDPSTGTFLPLPLSGAEPRAFHTATVLTDGRVLIAGGTTSLQAPATAAEVWDVDAGTVTPIAAGGSRARHTARLLADGRVLISGGVDPSGATVSVDEVFVPGVERISPATGDSIQDAPLAIVSEAFPTAGSVDVPVDVRLVLRFSRPLLAATLSDRTVELSGPQGALPVALTPAEAGRLLFIRPVSSLAPKSSYTLTVRGAADAQGRGLVPTSVTFETGDEAAPAHPSDQTVDEEVWIPDASSLANGWKTNRPKSSWEDLPPLRAAPGVTAVAGQVLTLDGNPLANVTLAIEQQEVRTDRTGRFLLTLTDSMQGHRGLEIEGETANRGTRRYGFFEYGLTVAAGETTVLPFTIWMPRLDTAHEVVIPSPTTRETVITTPYVPGLEVHLPAGTVITGEDGKVVTRLGITPIPVDRPPFPLARNVNVPVYFTVQPGGAYVGTSGIGAKGAWVVYPNLQGAVPNQEFQFFHYDPDARGWYVYGLGSVNDSGSQVVPYAKTRIYEFTGAMFNGAGSPPAKGATPGGGKEGDPVDPSTGLFIHEQTDLYLPDVIPLALTRTYNSADTIARPFGRGMTNPYSMFAWSANQYQEVDLILPDGGRVHFVRTSPGTGWADAVFVHQETATTSATPTRFYKSRMVWNGDGWDLTLKDGTVYVLGENAPLQAIRDRYGNTVRIAHTSGQGGNVTQVTSPNGRWISFTYDTSSRVTQAKDNIGRTVTYTYDANGNLSTVTDPENNVTTYGYTSNVMTSIKDGRNITHLTNEYTNGRVTRQTLADPSSTYTFAYTLDASNNVTRTDITDPRGHVERLTFNTDHYVLSDVQAVGTGQERTFTTERQAGSNLVTATVDGLNRRTAYTFDDAGYVLTVTRLAGTSDAVTTTYTYEPTFRQQATITDPLGHTWTRGYDAAGRLTSVSDPLTHQTGVTLNTSGQVTALTDALQHTWQFGYLGGDLVARTDPLSRVSNRFVDAAGRVVTRTDAAGRIVRQDYDKLDRVTTRTDPIGAVTSYSFDPNNQVLAVTDALNHATSYTYDSSNRLAVRTDPLQQVESYAYDANGNLLAHTDRKGQVTQYTYDALDRLQSATYIDGSTTQYTYDAGDRVLQIADSAGGTVSRTYDLLDRMLSETTPEGTVTYTYDADGRRTTMSASGQATVTYDYDSAHRLLSVTQDSLTTTFAYDDADRRTSVTLPNGVTTTYDWDAASQLSALTYSHGTDVLGTLTYTYDALGDRIAVDGSWARTGLPQPLSSATYDAANRLVQWDGTTFDYDANGNLTSDGSVAYVWNARNQLASTSGGSVAAFAYDGVGRRRSKATNGTTSNFLYDRMNVIQEQTSGVPSANLVTGQDLDETLTRTDAAGLRGLLVDALGSTIALTDASGAVQTQYTYDPYGLTTASGAASSNPFQFTGRENDGAGWYYYRARYYSPGTARFVSEDPLEFSGNGPNLYQYVGDSPISNADPTGCAFVDCGRAIADLMRAIANAKKDLGNADKHGRSPDPGHQKEMEQRRRDLQDSLKRVLTHCGKVAAAAAAVAEALEVLAELAAYLEFAAVLAL